jgi:hypothetical protein
MQNEVFTTVLLSCFWIYCKLASKMCTDPLLSYSCGNFHSLNMKDLKQNIEAGDDFRYGEEVT